jgi:hypothetical protein
MTISTDGAEFSFSSLMMVTDLAGWKWVHLQVVGSNFACLPIHGKPSVHVGAVRKMIVTHIQFFYLTLSTCSLHSTNVVVPQFICKLSRDNKDRIEYYTTASFFFCLRLTCYIDIIMHISNQPIHVKIPILTKLPTSSFCDNHEYFKSRSTLKWTF